MNPSDRNMTVMYLFLILVSMISQSMSQGINLALGKPVTMSSTDYYIFNWTGSLAVDGAVPGTQSTDDCRCCSGTQRNVDNWLTVDLGDIYTIRRINVQGRTENTNGRIHDTTLHILNTTGDTEQQVFTQQAISQTFTWTAPTGTLTRFVTLREPNYDWLIVCEIRVFKRDCVAGKYGPVCTQDCSDNCAGRICDQTRGHCDRCDPGKHGDTCTEPCPQHCAGDVCNKTDGYCTNGCQEGYEGQRCESGINLGLGKPVTMSSTEYYMFNWNGSLAVDGKVPVTRRTCDCQCCSSTQGNVDNWLTVDLGEIYTISSINVQGRTDGHNGRLQGTTLHILNTTGGTEQQVFTQQVNSQTFTWTAPTGTLTRFVTLREPNYDLLIVCEIRVFKRDCVVGKYGPVCSQDCSDKCASCDQTSGHCVQCIPGKYGDTCTEPCPQHCAGDVCDRTDGQCPNGCKEGYQGQRCESVCEIERYGYNCSRECHCGDRMGCHGVSGLCKSPLCLPGWKGLACNQGCEEGTFGANCLSTCRCTDGGQCSPSDGHCGDNPCLPGWQGPSCQKACDDGTYGQNCSFTCGNCVTNTCTTHNGTCTRGCSKGFTGFLCTQADVQDPTSSGPIIGAVVGSMVAFLIIAVVMKQRQKSQRPSQRATASHVHDNEAFGGNITEDVHQGPVTDDTYQDLHVYNEPGTG